MDALVAVVEIDGTTGVIVLAVFVIVFLVVAVVGWLIVRNTTLTLKSPPTWVSTTDIPLPVSQRAKFDRLTNAVTKATSRPSLTSEQQQFVAGLANTRKKLATGYRSGLTVAGMAGVALSIAIYRDYRDDDMILLPVAIIFLLSLGVLISGLIPGPVVDPIDPIDPALLKNIHVDVRTEPLTIQLDDTSTRKAIEMLKRGINPEEVARRIVSAYDRLDDCERQAVKRTIATLRYR